jgi:ATP-binding cassette, subfamily B (MDR/TAP), member 1
MFGDGWDYFMIGLCTLTAIGSGAAMPLMFLVFGNLVGSFTGYFMPNTTITKQQFMAQVTKNT